MRSKTNKFNAVKTTANGIKFDSKYESQVYLKLRHILRLESIHCHHRAAYLGENGPDKRLCISNAYWRVDFMIKDGSKSLFAIEAKGRFTQPDKFKFLLWELYQNIPLIVVHSERNKPRGLHSSGLVHFLVWEQFNLMSGKDLVELVKVIKNRCRG
ncbi:DUF1064 domain-containing protein [Okeania sp. KiyG1]|uniref:DUF1064 domain-containing protein n=1 Tax=Okeania sp. KiyG1 TaxID=2720165 RepID=UPI0019217539|nr:DUF1064 domain-containing protein [Okeania sp. KiyG1]GGA14003.1 hypothetical protein CYANOKiyG1_27510 [Okeania sp. KiyG1]